ncbi:hypothetical protein PV04_02571 [Phialophora macrospora]|uniref:Transcription factor domain-containing protein n=1 Tax=Phialophora macrospora TaxID=1851006 RepID=A0A0D2CYJ2_9EURO|nr:hypothetical protein PV04_02571 [Phialophora macrospora]
MTNPEFMFLVRTPGTYPGPGGSRPKLLNSEARAHAARVYYRQRHSTEHQKDLESHRSRPARVLLPKFNLNKTDGVDSQHCETSATTADSPQNVHWQLTSLLYPVDVLPGVPHRGVSGFAEALEFHRGINPAFVHAPVFHVFDVSNSFVERFYELATHEVGLHAGIAVVNMVRDAFRPDFHDTGPSPHVLRLNQVAMSKLRRYLSTVECDTVGRQNGCGSHDAAVIAAVFLGHIARGYGDIEAFRMHRQGIKMMVESRGGLDTLGLAGMVKSSVLQFESWWTHLYNDTSIFDSYKPPYNPTYLSAPLSASDLSLLARLPSGFNHLARAGMIATDIIEVLSNVVSYGENIEVICTTFDGSRRFPKTRVHVPSPAVFRGKKRHEDFWQACACLLVPGPNFEKYLVFALLLFVGAAFAPGENGRKYLACSHTAFRTPRACLTRELPSFETGDIPQGMDRTNPDSDRSREDAKETMQQCLVWIWLVLVESWRATDGVDSSEAKRLQDMLKLKFTAYAAWEKVNVVLGRFFCTEAMISHLRQSWTDPSPGSGVVSGSVLAGADADAFSSSLGN